MTFVITLIAMLVILGFVVAVMNGKGKQEPEKKSKEKYKYID